MTYSQKTLDLLLNGQIEAAKKEFAWALRKDEPDLLYSLAEELLALGFSNMAKRIYQKLLQEFPQEDELKTALAEILILEGKDDEALEYLQQIPATSDAYLAALLVLADLYQTQGLFEISEQKLLQAHQLAPDEEVIWFALAELYYSMQDYQKALGYYLDLVKADILEYSQINLLQRLGICYAAQGEFEAAKQYLEQIPPAKLNADILFQLGFTQLQVADYEKAITSFEKLKELSADYATLYPYLGTAYEKMGRLQEAYLTLQEGVSVDEYNVSLYQSLARVALKLNQPADAKKHLQKALKLEPDNLTSVIEYSNLLEFLHEDEDNLAFLNEYLANNQTDPQLFWNRGKILARQDHYAQALEDYQAILPELENSVEFLADAAVFFRNAGQRQLALRCAKAYLSQVNDDFEMEQLYQQLSEDEYLF